MMRCYSDGLKFACLMCGWGIFVAAVCLVPWTALQYRWRKNQPTDFENMDLIPVSTAELCRRAGNVFERYYCFEVETGWVFFVGMVTILVPLYWGIYVRLSLRVFAAIFLLQWGLHFCCVAVFHLGPTQDFKQWFLPLNAVLFTVPVVIISIKHRSGQLAVKGFQFFMLAGIGTTLTGFYDALQGHVHALVLLLLIVPAIRSAALTIMRIIVKPLFVDEHKLGSDVKVRRETAWFILLFVQFVFSLLSRMLVVNLVDWGQYVLFLVANSLTEVVLRYSPMAQDQLFKEFQKKFGLRKQGSLIMPVTGEVVSGIQLTADQVERSQKQWYALVVVGDMIAEYVAIFTNLGLLYLFRNSILVMPLPVYELQKDPFGEPMPVETWFYQAITQIIGELLVDWFCFSMEHLMLRFPIREAWNFKPRLWKFIALVAATHSSTIFVVSFFKHRRYEGTHWCDSINMCSCGPIETSLFGRYCATLNQTYPAIINPDESHLRDWDFVIVPP